uniref:Uncharacterized protein n=1 Tax=Digenea simplex TaxID=945030 RepID=A0A1Z1MUD8_DIGSM|nr:hypothetical protein [Digenea simplex]ARW69499.1 hypothetical protein [Digenea simplex]
MALSNFILFHTISRTFLNTNQITKREVVYSKQNLNRSLDLYKTKYHKNQYLLASNNKHAIDNSRNQLNEKKQKNELTRRNFWQKIINQYWQETIIVSPSTNILENYVNKLKTSGLSVHSGNDYRNFLSRFSKDLLDNKIQLRMNYEDELDNSILDNNNYISIQYRWPKSLVSKYYTFQKVKSDPYHYMNIHKATNTLLPLFLLANNKNELILSESPSRLFYHKIWLKLSSLANKKSYENKKNYTGLIFTSPEDSIEYQKYILNQYKNSSRSNYIKSVATNMSLYLRLLKSTYVDTDFRLVPDLKEVSDLLCKYRKYSNVSFDSKQKYGYNYFQGQPVYLIKPITVGNKYRGNKYKINYSYSCTKKDKIVKYNAVFLSYQTAVNAWEKFREEHKNIKLPCKPNLYVSNLEAFIQTPEYQQNSSDFIFLPSQQTYNFLKHYFQLNTKYERNIVKLLISRSLDVRSLFYKIFWSLTSRQPIDL